jgi:PAS domain S-box-containing protein
MQDRTGGASLADTTGAAAFLAGGGELGELMRARDWASTPLGAPAHWPQSLKTAVRIMLTSRQPIWVGWGQELTYLYNDPYKSIIGGRHPWALGRSTSEVWREIWSEIGPMLATAMGGQEGTYVEAQLLIMERNGYPEETYYTFSYSPIPNDDGSAGGIICANTDDTQRVIGQRQLALLSELGAGMARARTAREAAKIAAEALTTNSRDLPFAMLYLADHDGDRLQHAGASGIDADHAASPPFLALTGISPWPVQGLTEIMEPRIVDDLDRRFRTPLPTGAWNQPVTRAAILPISSSGESGWPGALIMGLNPCRLLDGEYTDFLNLVGGQISAGIVNADAHERERRRAEALAEIDRAKTLFFSNVSHEFRTPLTLMLGPLEEMLDGEATLAEEDRARGEVAHRNAVRLLKLVNSLLDFSRIEAGRMDASFEATDLAALTADLASNFRSATERAGLTLTVDCRTLAEPVYVDRDLWEKVVLNLLSNAFKFTFAGEIAVRVRAAEGMAEVTVADTGTGIPAAELPRLFERFHRIEGARGRSFEGSGIGLALVHELVGLHHGSIQVESDDGRGTTFTIRLPFGCAHLAPEQIRHERTLAPTAVRAYAFVEEALRWLPDSTAGQELEDSTLDLASAERGERATILLADDNADMRDYVRRLLGDHHEVVTVTDGQAALESVRRRRPDLLLTDIMMPRLDGFELLRAIRADAALKDLPVIVLSARAGADARIEGLAVGADDYLVKPFSARELIARVDGALMMARLRREMTDLLRASEERFRNMADNSPVMIWTTDPDGACTYLSRLWYEFTGQTPASGLGFGWLDATHPDDRAAAEAEFLAATAERRPFTLEYRLRRRDGSFGWAIDAATPWFDRRGAFLGFVGSVIDITERRNIEDAQRRLNDLLEQRVAEAIEEREQAEAQLRQAQKMEAVGKLTGGIAHDFNNLLQVIGGNLQLLQKDVAGNPRAEQRLRNAVAGVSRGATLALQLLSFGRRQPLAPKVVNLARLVRGLDEIMRRTLGEAIEVETIIGGGLWNTLVDPSQVENALLNLAINARDAMAGRGKLTIEAGNASLDERYALRNDTTPGQYVMLAVTDTGCGMPAEIVEHVFEPFFTTKPEGQGTGLGLSMVYGFVRQSGGHVKIYSEVGHGTTIRIYLPRARADEDAAPDVDSTPVDGGRETILVVEDDDDVRSTVVEMLTDLGYRVLRARDAQSAFAIIESGAAIDLLFTDVVMPGPMRSTELARKARERLPGIVVLFTSGYADNAIVHHGRLDEGIELLSKPYTQEELARKIRLVLPHDFDTGDGDAGSAADPAGLAPRTHARTEHGPTRRVLVVEDDAMIRMATVEMLASRGHRVREAATAQEALAILRAEACDVLLADVRLPGDSGIELASAARREFATLRIVFATGQSLLPEVDTRPELADAVLLQKPFDERRLVEAIG